MPEDIAASPVQPSPEREPAEGTALCLSGGGYRAMLFHLGALWRINEVGLLPKLARISSVSGGSITAGALAIAWKRLRFDTDGTATNFDSQVVEPLRRVASATIDQGAVIGGILLPGSVSDRVQTHYRRLLFGDSTLQDLPAEEEGPRFVMNATNLHTGVLWRFSRPYMADYRLGRVDQPQVSLATAVAASSAFPPVLSPVQLEIDPGSYTDQSKAWELARLQAVGSVSLTDGGVYDNLGLETAWKRYQTILVSDGGGVLSVVEKVERDWARHSIRVLKVIDSQVRNLRKRQLISAFRGQTRTGTFWGIRSAVADYGLDDPLWCDPDKTASIAKTPTRLKKLPRRRQMELINWGYAICDTALRRWVEPDLAAPDDFPYPSADLS